MLAESPKFDRYEETDVRNDLRLMGINRYDDDDQIMGVNNTGPNNSSGCHILNSILEQDNYPTSLPDISALNIFSDGKYLNYTAWFYPGQTPYLVQGINTFFLRSKQ